MVEGYSSNQRKWFHKVYGHRCHFPGFNSCDISDKLHVHHIKPKGFYVQMVGADPNHAFNGILLCDYHHVGIGYDGPIDWRIDDVPVIHPDVVWARRQYGSNKDIYTELFGKRVGQVKNGLTYWNTTFDKLLEEIAHETIWQYMKQHPEDVFKFKK